MDIDYTTHDGKRWRCSAFGRIQIELEEFTEADLPALHGALIAMSRPWFVARQYFGLMPIIPPPDYDLSELRVLSVEEITGDLGIKIGDFKQEMNAIRGIWLSSRPMESEAAAADIEDRAVREANFSGEFNLATADPSVAIVAAGFPLTMFRVAQRAESENLEEMKWFAGRIQEFRKPLTDPMAKGLAAGILVKELLIKRKRDHLCTIDMKTAGKQTQELSDDLRKDETAYNLMLVQLDKVAPWMGKVGNSVNFHGVVADMVRAIQEWMVSNDSSLVDGMFTATEVQVQLRTSKQSKGRPQYRADIVTMVNAARAHLMDRNWELNIPAAQWKRLQTAWMKADDEVRAMLQERMVDLTVEGPSGEYDPILQSPKPA